MCLCVRMATAPIPLSAVFLKEYRCMPEDVRKNLSRPSGFLASDDGEIIDEQSGKIVPVTRRYACKRFVVLHMHDVDVDFACEVAFGRVAV